MPGYRRLSREFYDLDKPSAPPDAFEFYRAFALRAQGPIWEPMCGSGRFLLPLLAAGFDIEGSDDSPDMLQSCRERARARGLEPKLRQARLQDDVTERRFALVFIPSGSFSLLTDEASIDASLARIHEALAPGGRFVVEVERVVAREVTQSGPWGGTWLTRADGAKIVLSWLSQYSGVEAISRSLHRYELFVDGRLVETELEELDLKFHEPAEFQHRLERAGFCAVEQCKPYEPTPPDADDDGVVFVARKAPAV